MSRKPDGTRRSSEEERRILRTARLEFVELRRIAGMDPVAAEFMRDIDFAHDRLLNVVEWTEPAIDILALTMPSIVVGNVDGHAALAWLANPHLLLAMQAQWPGDRLIPVIVLAHQISDRTKRLVTGTSLMGTTALIQSQPIRPDRLHDVWQALCLQGSNPLTAAGKMAFVHAMRCDPRKLPAARAAKTGTQP